MVIKTSASIAAASAQEDVDLDHGLNVAGVQAEVAGATTPCSRDSLPTPSVSYCRANYGRPSGRYARTAQG